MKGVGFHFKAIFINAAIDKDFQINRIKDYYC